MRGPSNRHDHCKVIGRPDGFLQGSLTWEGKCLNNCTIVTVKSTILLYILQIITPSIVTVRYQRNNLEYILEYIQYKILKSVVLDHFVFGQSRDSSKQNMLDDWSERQTQTGLAR